MSTYDDILGSALSKFSKLVKKPERYIKPDNDLLEELRRDAPSMFEQLGDHIIIKHVYIGS